MSVTHFLVINCGSSSVKFSLFKRDETLCWSGIAERLGGDNAQCLFENTAPINLSPGNHETAINKALDVILDTFKIKNDAIAVGHRVVHGGEYFSKSVIIDQLTLERIQSCTPLAPLHNPVNIQGIETLQKRLPEAPQVAVFDTAFHQTLPSKAFTYALPHRFYKDFHLRRYGFHGTSHAYVAEEACSILNKAIDDCRLIIAHLGNGCSITAVKNGQSVDTSMGVTPLEGLVMGTRCGDIDPSIHAILAERLQLDIHQVTELLNKESGLLGISELSNDMRTLCEAAESGNKQAELAIEVFCYRLAKYIAAMAVPLEGIDALIFTGGIGENAALVRKRVIEQLKILGFYLQEDRNANNGRESNHRITTDNSKTALVIKTNEELRIAQETMQLVKMF